MLENQLSRYGAISKVIPDLAPGAKVFIVGDADDTNISLGNEFPADKDGLPRVYQTIQAAVNAATAGRGDVILVSPSYDQSITGADSWDKAGVQIIGMGNGLSRPTIRYTGSSGEVGLSANNVRVSNIRFLAAADSIARALDLDTGFSGQRVDNCIFDFNATTNDFRVMLRLGSQKAVIENNRFLAEIGAGPGKGISLKGGAASYSIIRNNYFYGQFDTVGDTSNGAAVIGQDTTDTSDTNLSGLLIENNEIVLTDTAAAMAIRVSAGYTITGSVIGNRIAKYDSAGADTDIVATLGLRLINNLVRGDSTEKTLGL